MPEKVPIYFDTKLQHNLFVDFPRILLKEAFDGFRERKQTAG